MHTVASCINMQSMNTVTYKTLIFAAAMERKFTTRRMKQVLPDLPPRSLFTLQKTSSICWESVTFIWNVFNLSLVTDFKLCSPSFVKQVANTRTPILSNFMAVSRPKPESQPVIKTYLPFTFKLALFVVKEKRKRIKTVENATTIAIATGNITWKILSSLWWTDRSRWSVERMNKNSQEAWHCDEVKALQGVKKWLFY